jgi:hypothetical protein
MANESVQEAKVQQLAALLELSKQADDAFDEMDVALLVHDDLTQVFFMLGAHPQLSNREHLARVGNYAAVHLWADLNGVKNRLEEFSKSSSKLRDSLESIWRLEREAKQ